MPSRSRLLHAASPIRLLFATLLLLPAAAAAEERAGRWTVVAGSVRIARVGEPAPRAAAKGGPLAVGDRVETGVDGHAQALLADNSVLNLSSNTSLSLLQYAWDPAADRRTAVAKVHAGQVRFVVGAHKESRFTVETPQASASARAADFVAVVDPTQTRVAVLDGGVSLKNIEKLIVEKVDLRPLQASTVGAGAAPTHPEPLLDQDRGRYRKDANVF
jgi:ferric-dicitrate binding protein FerR (iron transport regulator)